MYLVHLPFWKMRSQAICEFTYFQVLLRQQYCTVRKPTSFVYHSGKGARIITGYILYLEHIVIKHLIVFQADGFLTQKLPFTSRVHLKSLEKNLGERAKTLFRDHKKVNNLCQTRDTVFEVAIQWQFAIFVETIDLEVKESDSVKI